MSKSPLQDRTVKELKAMADEAGITATELREMAGGKTPTKATYITALTEAGAAPTWTPPETKTAAELTRAGLLAGIPDKEIIATIRAVYPEYGAWKIAVPVYRRELRKKGLLPEGS